MRWGEHLIALVLITCIVIILSTIFQRKTYSECDGTHQVKYERCK